MRAAIAKPHNCICSEHAGDDRQNGGANRHIHRVPQPMRIVAFEQQLVDMLECRIPGPERIELVEIEQLLVRFDRRQTHPVEREQQDEHDDRQRQVKRDEAPRQGLQVAHALAMIVHRGRRRRARQHGFEIDRLRCGKISHWTLPAVTSGSTRGACPVRAKINNAARRELSHSILPAATCGVAVRTMRP